MKTIGIFYGSSGGNTEGIAKQLASRLGLDKVSVHDVRSAEASDLGNYDVLLFGSSTWGLGDLQDDWEVFIRTVSAADLSGKTVALFGCGDSSSYADTFCEALGLIYKVVKDKTSVVGRISLDGYTFDASEAVVGGQFVGLALDEDNESDLTAERLDRWVAQLKCELDL